MRIASSAASLTSAAHAGRVQGLCDDNCVDLVCLDVAVVDQVAHPGIAHSSRFLIYDTGLLEVALQLQTGGANRFNCKNLRIRLGMHSVSPMFIFM